MTDTHVLLAPRWYEPSGYKLYVSSVASFDKTSLKEYFSRYSEVVDIYMSEPNETGFKWAFVYFSSEEGLLEAVAHIERENVHNFKLSRAKPKSFLSNYAKLSPNASLKPSINGDVALDSKPFVPNCSHCKKLTFQRCSTCPNSFCSKECMLDGWRCHTGPCVRVAELTRISETNGQDYSITPTVVNFMKDMNQTKKNFTTKEFADACNYSRGMVNAAPGAPKSIENDWDDECANDPPIMDKRPHGSHDKGRRPLAASFQKQLSISNNDEVDISVTKAMPKKFNKSIRTHQENEMNRQPLVSNGSHQHSSRDRDHQQTDTEENYNHHRSKMAKRKPNSNRRNQTDMEDTERSERNTRKTFPKPIPKSRESDTEEASSHRVKKSSSEKSSVAPIRGREREKISPQVYESDLKLKPNETHIVLVTSIVNNNSFFVANSDKIINMLRRIDVCADGAPPLSNVSINTRCLAFYDEAYYRAQVISTDPLEVVYIDYGNKEACDIKSLRVLPESLAECLPLATKVQLESGEVRSQGIDENKEITMFIREFKSSDHAWVVEVL